MRRLLLLPALLAACAGEPSADRLPPSQAMTGVRMAESQGGDRLWELDADSARSSDPAEPVSLAAPLLRLHKEGRPAARIRSLTGVFDPAERSVLLSGEVRAEFLDDGSVLHSPTLRYSPDRGKIWTDDAVRIERPEGVVRGRGFESEPDLSEMRIREQESVLR